jgi:hypothetical protein
LILTIFDIQYNSTLGYTECHAEFHDYLNVMLRLVLLNVVMLSVVMLSVVMLSVVMLNVVMLGVVAHLFYFQTFKTKIQAFFLFLFEHTSFPGIVRPIE